MNYGAARAHKRAHTDMRQIGINLRINIFEKWIALFSFRYFQCLQFETMFERYFNTKIPIISVVKCARECVFLISSMNVNRPLFQWWIKMLAIFVPNMIRTKEKCERLKTFAFKILLLVFFCTCVSDDATKEHLKMWKSSKPKDWQWVDFETYVLLFWTAFFLLQKK